jgi:propionyl-CoA carboxylase alpha chain
LTVRKILIANRGEIARRVIRTSRRLGISTVAVYSEADSGAPFVREADEAVPIGGSAPAQSYLRGEAVVQAALVSGADAVHPGYGFLSESSGFARQVMEAGLTWVGPSPESIDAMGSKLAAREMMAAAGVPVLPGADLTGVSPSDLLRLADGVGWPVLVKASAGGGGRGMRVVRDPADLPAAVEAAGREASAAFGDGTVFLEHYVDSPRHIEIQILGDQHGNLVHLFERECSIQRRHQKVVEESPSPVMTDALRAAMTEAAVAAGRAIGYTGAGTVEFVVAPDGRFYFLEVNTRLQVEHPVTEEVTGLDLVALQLAVAEGQPLPAAAVRPSLNGHAIEVRLCAEDPLNDYLPTTGRIHSLEFPTGEGIRIETAVESGDEVSVHYDSMLAKIIAYGDSRADAIRKLGAALRRTRIHGVVTNRDLLLAVISHEEFAAGRIDTHFLERHPPRDLIQEPADAEVGWCGLAAALAAQSRERIDTPVWKDAPSGWRNNRADLQRRRFRHGDRSVDIGYSFGPDGGVQIDGRHADAEIVSVTPTDVDMVVDGLRRRFEVSRHGRSVWVESWRASVHLESEPRFPDPDEHRVAGSLLAPMPGVVARIDVQEGDRVAEGQVLLVLEAMKMEHPIVAPVDGILASLGVGPGDNVDSGAVLAVISGGEEEG